MIFLALAFLLATQADPVVITPQMDAALQKGGVMIGIKRDTREAAGQVEAVIDIQAPAMLVWDTLMDCAHAAEFVPNLISCKVISRDPGGAWEVREHIVDAGWFLPNIRSQFRADVTPGQEIRFQQIEGDFEVMQGRWLMTSQSGGGVTRLSYQARLKPGMWVPDFLIQSLIETEAPETLKAVRAEVLRRMR